jgi:NADPH:quinone reductase-like Zn-dependent oxidoreductase
MKAIIVDRLGPPQVLALRDVGDPVSAPGQVLIRVEAAGVNFGDVMRRRGDIPSWSTTLPFVPGAEVAGTVAALGAGVAGPVIGTRVLGLAGTAGTGGYAELMATDAANVVPIPASLSAEQACSIAIPGLTALLCLREAGRLAPGETVFVQAAAGGVGSYAVQLAKVLGAGRVVGGVGSQEKVAAARASGADDVIVCDRPGWGEAARHATGGSGADVALDMVGGSVFAETLSRVLAPFGRLVTYGQAGREPQALDPQALLLPNQSVHGFYIGNWLSGRPAAAGAALADLLSWAESGLLTVPLGQVLPLAAAAEAHLLLESRRSTGRIALRVAGAA